MNTLDIVRKLYGIANFVGVFPRNELPTIKSRNVSLVANTDTSDKPGTHWVAIFVQENEAEYFDSFGLPPLTTDFVTFLDSYENWRYNTVTIQDVNSEKCGHFCVAFIKKRNKGYTFDDFVRLFSTSCVENDKIVMKYI